MKSIPNAILFGSGLLILWVLITTVTAADAPPATQPTTTQSSSPLELGITFLNLDAEGKYTRAGAAPLETELHVKNTTESHVEVGLPIRVVLQRQNTEYKPGVVEASWQGKCGIVILIAPPATQKLIGFHFSGAKGGRTLPPGETWKTSLDFSEVKQSSGAWAFRLLVVQDKQVLVENDAVILQVK